jgi:hypothetical protein
MRSTNFFFEQRSTNLKLNIICHLYLSLLELTFLLKYLILLEMKILKILKILLFLFSRQGS